MLSFSIGGFKSEMHLQYGSVWAGSVLFMEHTESKRFFSSRCIYQEIPIVTYAPRTQSQCPMDLNSVPILYDVIF